MKIVLDSNVLISAFAARGLCADLFRDVVSSHDLLISEYILSEVTEKLIHKLKIPESTTRDIEELLKGFVVPHPPDADALADIPIRDPDDLPIVAFAFAIAADALITGDRDLLDISHSFPCGSSRQGSSIQAEQTQIAKQAQQAQNLDTPYCATNCVAQ